MAGCLRDDIFTCCRQLVELLVQFVNLEIFLVNVSLQLLCCSLSGKFTCSGLEVLVLPLILERIF